MRKIYKKVMRLLDARQKRQMVGIVFMMLIGGILESFGIALIAPIMEVLTEPELINESKTFSFIYYSIFNFNEDLSDSAKLVSFFMIVMIFVFVVKNIFLFFMNKVQLKFVYTNQFATSRRMMINFMQRPYEYYLNADTSVIQRNITSDVNNMYGLILSSLGLISETIVFACLVIMCLFFNAKMTVFIAVLLGTVLLIIKFII